MKFDKDQPIAQWYDEASGQYVDVSLDELLGNIRSLHMSSDQLHILRQTICWALTADPADVSYRYN